MYTREDDKNVGIDWRDMQQRTQAVFELGAHFTE